MNEYEDNIGEHDEVYDKSWLKRLQRGSWELELLISGFSIVLLSQVIDYIDYFNTYIDNMFIMEASMKLLLILSALVNIGFYAITMNLIFHLLLRGFWVGVVGLSSVSSNISFERLNLSPLFERKLQEKKLSLNDLVIKLDKICSVIFSFSFLIFFFMISFGLFSLVLTMLSSFFNTIMDVANTEIAEKIVEILAYIFILSYIIAALLYFVDFLTLGFLKSIKFMSKIYYPIYYVFGVICFVFLYRTIYYHFISKFSKKRIFIVLIPYIFLLIFVPFTRYDHHIYFPDNLTDETINPNYFDNLRPEKEFIQKVSIESDIIDGNLLKLFLIYKPENNNDIQALCHDFKPSKTEGLKHGFQLTDKGLHISGTPKINEKDPRKALDCVSKLYMVYINDSLLNNPKYFFTEHPNKGEKGIRTVIDISKLPLGYNELMVRKIIANEQDDKTVLDTIVYSKFPFWKN